MRKMILMGKSECGKTTLTQALKGEPIHYQKTQYINHYDVIIDTPGEYAENRMIGGALALFAYEADVVGLIISATEQYSLFSPNITSLVNREVIGIVTQIDQPTADPVRAKQWLHLAGCEKVFFVSAVTGEGVWEIMEYLKEEGDVLTWEQNHNPDKETR